MRRPSRGSLAARRTWPRRSSSLARTVGPGVAPAPRSSPVRGGSHRARAWPPRLGSGAMPTHEHGPVRTKLAARRKTKGAVFVELLPPRGAPTPSRSRSSSSGARGTATAGWPASPHRRGAWARRGRRRSRAACSAAPDLRVDVLADRLAAQLPSPQTAAPSRPVAAAAAGRPSGVPTLAAGRTRATHLGERATGAEAVHSSSSSDGSVPLGLTSPRTASPKTSTAPLRTTR